MTMEDRVKTIKENAVKINQRYGLNLMIVSNEVPVAHSVVGVGTRCPCPFTCEHQYNLMFRKFKVATKALRHQGISLWLRVLVAKKPPKA